jgi:hypothetical protein
VRHLHGYKYKMSGCVSSVSHFSGVHIQKLKSNKVKKIASQIFSVTTRKQMILNWLQKKKDTPNIK